MSPMIRLIESLNISSLPVVNALISIMAFIILAKAADLFVGKVLRRFSRFTKSDLDDRILDLIHRPVFFTIILIGVTLALAYLIPAVDLLFYLKGVIYSVLSVIWMLAAMKISNILIEHSIHRVSDVTGLSKDIVPLIENVSKIGIILATLMVILSIWRVDITPLLASAGIAGAGVAIAAKDTIANFFGGISVFFDKPYKIGDFIVLDKGEKGEVVAIGIRSTRIKTLDDVMITVPNSLIANSKIINESAPTPNLRIRIPVGVAYGTEIGMVEEILLGIAMENSNVLMEPPPTVSFISFGEYALNLELLCWIREPARRLRTLDELNRAIYKGFMDEGVKIPFPQREVHIKTVDSSQSAVDSPQAGI
ncbi:MAG: mechanosensitive ion channel domain-containing protein [Thermodesulfovibrionales bacterium]|jgi:small-conductance mechanosensitive channel